MKHNGDNWINNIRICLERKIILYIDNILTFYTILTYYTENKIIDKEYFMQLFSKCCNY